MKHLIVSLRITVVLIVITCGLYPLLIWGVAQLAFPARANGSLVTRNGHVIGSELIGQSFAAERFFHARPGSYDATASGGTNLGPTSKKLRDAVAASVAAYDVHSNVPADAVTSSASGLDPHISSANAHAQAARVARANGVAVAQIEALIDRHIERRFLGIYGEPRINVLRLNLDVMELKP